VKLGKKAIAADALSAIGQEGAKLLFGSQLGGQQIAAFTLFCYIFSFRVIFLFFSLAG